MNTLDKSFNDRLKQVYVTSINKVKLKDYFQNHFHKGHRLKMFALQNPSMDLPKDRPMPMDRMTPFAVTPHSQTTDVKKPNFLQINDLIELLSSHKENPEKWTVDYIASRFEISKAKAGKI